MVLEVLYFHTLQDLFNHIMLPIGLHSLNLNSICVVLFPLHCYHVILINDAFSVHMVAQPQDDESNDVAVVYYTLYFVLIVTGGVYAVKCRCEVTMMKC